MNNSYIKHLKPRKNSRYHQGYVNPNSLKKYATESKNEPIIFRSGLEWKFMEYCESNNNIVKWASEPIGIPYYNKLLKRDATYYIDYIIENKDGQRCMVEVKPYDQTVKPSQFSSDWAKKAWITNVCKWQAAIEYAKEHDMKFIIVTEKTLENDNI